MLRELDGKNGASEGSLKRSNPSALGLAGWGISPTNRRKSRI
jgi:hypothetical protein